MWIRFLNRTVVMSHRGHTHFHRPLSTSFVARSVWKEDEIAPVADRQYYYDNLPVTGDSMYTVNVRAAPTRNYYSMFYDPVLEKFAKSVLKKGRGDLADGIMRDTMRQIKITQLTKYHNTPDGAEKDAIELNPYIIFHEAMKNVSPTLGLKTSKRAATVFYIPIPLRDDKKFFMATRWILEYCRSGKPKTPMSQRLAKEILLAYKNEGNAVKKKQDLNRQVLANRAYIHLGWK